MSQFSPINMWLAFIDFASWAGQKRGGGRKPDEEDMVKGEVIVLDRDAEEVAPPKDADDGDCDEKFIVVDCSRPILVEKKNKNSIQGPSEPVFFFNPDDIGYTEDMEIQKI
ncbi:Protein CBG25766 [Caenorhabditis briggsae]|uniref:Protein CBG25766 n=1 Tax=Caenorhabditis briggsae TaxID=6238 RepID=B6IKE5_CAEBR|nr:Protein CBG25766 [Caenorhabditis briggsae]CAS00375.1 Protein CBG25766 [Caenorhabditis briggsae]